VRNYIKQKPAEFSVHCYAKYSAHHHKYERLSSPVLLVWIYHEFSTSSQEISIFFSTKEKIIMLSLHFNVDLILTKTFCTWVLSCDYQSIF